jgi:hypothetical protein
MRTFANQAERLAYAVLPHEAVQGVQWKQTEGSDDPDVPEIYRAVRQGTGAQCWEKAYTDAGGSGAALTTPVLSVTISSDQHNWAPTGGDAANLWRIAPSGATRMITGISSAFALNGDGTGRVLVLLNVSVVHTLVIGENTGDSDLANRFLGNLDVAITPGEGIIVAYDVASTCWRVLSPTWPRHIELSEAATIAWDVRRGLNATVSLTASRALAMTGLTAGLGGVLRVNQDGVGGRKFTSLTGDGAEAHVPGGAGAGVASLLTATADTSDLLGWFYDGTDLLVWNEGAAFASYAGV